MHNKNIREKQILKSVEEAAALLTSKNGETKTMIKKIYALMISAAMTLTLVGCGGGAYPGAPGQQYGYGAGTGYNTGTGGYNSGYGSGYSDPYSTGGSYGTPAYGSGTSYGSSPYSSYNANPSTPATTTTQR